jgi:long-chain fatty acid transport protein
MRDRASAWSVVGIVLAALAFSRAAHADEYHYQNFLLGARAMSMGGAYVALGASPASAWYNPAGLGFAKGSSLSVQTGLYGVVTDRTSGGASLAAVDNGSVITFPSTAVIVKELGGDRHRVALSVLTPEYDARAYNLLARNLTVVGQDGPVNLSSLSLVQDDQDTTLYAGPSYAFRAHPRLAVGASLFFAYRSRDLFTKLQTTIGDTVASAIQLDAQTWHLSVLGLLGVRFEPIDGLFFGATLRTPNARIGSNATLTGVTFTPGGARRGVVESVGAQYQLPWRVGVGVAYARPRAFALGADVTYHAAVDPYPFVETTTLESSVLQVARKSVLNVNVGAELSLNGSVALRAGFFTNFSAQGALPDDVVRDALFGLSGIVGGSGTAPDLYGLTVGLGYESRGTSVSFGVTYMFGSAQTVLATAVSERALRTLLFGIAGSYAF